jgi:hypothetical protein
MLSVVQCSACRYDCTLRNERFVHYVTVNSDSGFYTSFILRDLINGNVN